MRRILAGLLLLTLATLACGTGTPPRSTPEPAFVAATLVNGPQLGIAGLIPRNYPNPSAGDWTDLFTHLHETGNLVGVYTAWNDSPEAEGLPPEVIKTAFDLQKQYGVTPVIALSFYQDAAEDHLASLIRWDDTDQRERVVETARQIAESYQPPYFALGIEINRYYEEDPAGFKAYVDLYVEMYDAIKAISPQTLVFPIFQYEKMHGGVFFSGDNQAQPEWELLDKFNGRMDLIAFTTYPFLLYATPADLPNGYYTEITRHASQKIAFTEIGWPSAVLSAMPDSPFGGSPDEQSDFVRRFFSLTSDLPLDLALWSFPHDVGPDFNAAFTSISLRENNGTPKPALQVWRSYEGNAK
jgi:hypothetical protein